MRMHLQCDGLSEFQQYQTAHVGLTLTRNNAATFSRIILHSSLSFCLHGIRRNITLVGCLDTRRNSQNIYGTTYSLYTNSNIYTIAREMNFLVCLIVRIFNIYTVP